MPPSCSAMDRAHNEEIIRSLFECILERDVISDTELNYWTEELMAGRSLADVVRLFNVSEERQAKRSVNSGSSTKYPHGHFYSPVVDVAEISLRKPALFRDKTLEALDLNTDVQLATLRRVAKHASSIPFSDKKIERFRYYYGNTSFAFGDAVIYWGIIAEFRPRRILEVGSGYTSALALDAIEWFSLDTQCIFVDPHPELLYTVAAPIPAMHEVVPRIVQNIDLRNVRDLESGDILFIDSSHVVKTGSDVYFEITQMLPKLRSGVIVHFHDVFYPFEYPEPWILDDNYSWNEIYFLHVFLQYNTEFRVIYFNDYIAKNFTSELREVVTSQTAARIELNPGGGLWLQKV